MSDYHAPRHIVSVKAVISTDRGFVLLKNEREEWELPGGKLEYGEDPEEAINREIFEEIGVPLEVGPLIDAWIYHVNGVDVLILTYGVKGSVASSGMKFSDEHSDIGFKSLEQLDSESIPLGYVRSIKSWIDSQSHD